MKRARSSRPVLLTAVLVLGAASLALGDDERPRDRELLDGDFYRAADGRALLRLPAKPGWVVRHEGVDSVTLYKGDEKKWSAKIALDMDAAENGDGEKGLALASAVAKEVARAVVEANPWLETNEPLGKRFKVASGASCWAITYVGADPDEGGRKWCASVIAVTTGTRAVDAVVWTDQPTATEAFGLAQVVLEAVRQGDQIPRMPARAPGVALEGVYRGKYTTQYVRGMPQGEWHWFVFDKRGYATRDEDPSTDKWVDLETLWQSGERKRLLAYTIKGGELELTPLEGGKATRLPIVIGDRKVEVDGSEYARVDGGSLSGERLDGRWQSTTFRSNPSGITGTFATGSSATYVFRADGTFSLGKVAQSTLNDPQGANSHASSIKSDGGKYRVKGDRLVLAFGDERVVVTPIFPFSAGDTDILFLHGAAYFRDKEKDKK